MHLSKRDLEDEKKFKKNSLYWEKDPDVVDGNRSPMMNSTNKYRVSSSNKKKKEN